MFQKLCINLWLDKYENQEISILSSKNQIFFKQNQDFFKQSTFKTVYVVWGKIEVKAGLNPLWSIQLCLQSSMFIWKVYWLKPLAKVDYINCLKSFIYQYFVKVLILLKIHFYFIGLLFFLKKVYYESLPKTWI